MKKTDGTPLPYGEQVPGWIAFDEVSVISH